MKKNHKIKILLHKDAENAVKKMSVELALRTGQECVALEFPIIVDSTQYIKEIGYLYIKLSTNEKNEVTITQNEEVIEICFDKKVYQRALAYIVANYSNIVNGQMDQINPFDSCQRFQETAPVQGTENPCQAKLQDVFEKGALFIDTDGDFLPEQVRATLYVEGDLTFSNTVAAANMAARLGLETLGAKYPILAEQSQDNENRIMIKNSPKNRFYITHNQDKIQLHLEGSAEGIIQLSSYIATQFPKLGESRWKEYCEELEKSIRGKTIQGQLAYIDTFVEQGSIDKTLYTECYLEAKVDPQASQTKEHYKARQININTYKNQKEIMSKTYDIIWEVDEFKQQLERVLYPNIKKGDKVEILGVLSEDLQSRQGLVDEITVELKKRGIETADISIICAYKQGYSWAIDHVLPRLKEIGTVDKVEIQFKALLPEGRTEWNDEDGATPTANRRKTGDSNAWLDAPVRFLQELYPVDDILAMELGIQREHIQFQLLTEAKDTTYRAIAYAKGEKVYTAEYKTTLSERYYLEEYKSFGLVHPSTGRIYITVNDEVLMDQQIKTDLERVWEIYQGEILPYCKKHITEKCKGDFKQAIQPFFSQLRLDLEISEPDDSLPIRKDMISSISAFHEDLYFVGLDYFKSMGIETIEQPWDSPGMILPVIKKGTGKPKLQFTLLDQAYEEPMIINGQKEIKLHRTPGKLAVNLSSIELREEKKIAHIGILVEEDQGLIQPFIRNYIRLMGEGWIEHNHYFAEFDQIVFEANGIQHSYEPQKAALVAPIAIEEIDIMPDKVIGYDEYLSIIEQLKRVKGIRVYQVATSYQGRAIHAIELVPSYKGYVSTTKLINEMPSHYINNRHHANEVSSTNGALMLIKDLLTNKKYANLADKLNLVIVPFENPDGAAIHYELQKENPEWQLHIARFNALGREFAYEYFHDDTIHTEALAFTKVWRKWLPDVCTDNHGVPSHEWDQQFSGYIVPWFKGFWLPRALWYGYFWYVTEEKYAGNMGVCKAIQKEISGRLNGDQEISGWNAEWKDRFEKYGHAWMPKLFPANYEDNLIYYWVPYTSNPNNFYASIKYPWITSAFLTSEIADETAQGDYLTLCARTHMLNDLAVIDTLTEASCQYETKLYETGQDMSYSNIRVRPMICK